MKRVSDDENVKAGLVELLMRNGYSNCSFTDAETVKTICHVTDFLQSSTKKEEEKYNEAKEKLKDKILRLEKEIGNILDERDDIICEKENMRQDIHIGSRMIGKYKRAIDDIEHNLNEADPEEIRKKIFQVIGNLEDSLQEFYNGNEDK